MNIPVSQPVSQWFRRDINIKVPNNFSLRFVLLASIIAFEFFNFGATEYALRDLLGENYLAGFNWSSILTFAFCAMDFAGMAYLLNVKNINPARRTWFLFGAWLLASTMNALMTWWGVSIAVTSHDLQSRLVFNSDIFLVIIPVFVAVFVWLLRILLIGTFSSFFTGTTPVVRQKNGENNENKKAAFLTRRAGLSRKSSSV